MRDAFGEDLSLGDRVFCIVGFGSSQTLYAGIVEEFVGNCVRVLIERVPDIPGDSWLKTLEGQEKRVCVPHRLAQVKA